MATIAEIAKKLNKEFKDDTLAIKADVSPSYERMSTKAMLEMFNLFLTYDEYKKLVTSEAI